MRVAAVWRLETRTLCKDMLLLTLSGRFFSWRCLLICSKVSLLLWLLLCLHLEAGLRPGGDLHDDDITSTRPRSIVLYHSVPRESNKD